MGKLGLIQLKPGQIGLGTLVLDDWLMIYLGRQTGEGQNRAGQTGAGQTWAGPTG